MKHYYLDPSAWSKRYIIETGSELINTIWDEIRAGQAFAYCQWLGFTEVASVLLRRKNAGQIAARQYAPLQMRFEDDCRFVKWLEISWELVQLSSSFILKYNLNATDALHLQCALEAYDTLGLPITVVSSDRRLLRAAAAENLTTLNPETASESV